MKVDKALTLLRAAERTRLSAAFEAGESDYVNKDGILIGVHLDKLEYLEIIDRQGFWATARRRDA